MKNNQPIKYIFAVAVIFSMVAPVFAQRGRRPVIFAVLSGGKVIEPIAFVMDRKLTPALGGDAEQDTKQNFASMYYKPKTKYSMIFGGANAGSITVLKNDPTAECSSNMAETTAFSNRAKLGGFVMSLATDMKMTSAASGTRRKPTAAEKSAIDALVRAEFTKQKVVASATKTLNYHNLTAIDANNDKKVEMVGSYWVSTSKTTRALLFFIAEPTTAGRFKISYSEFGVMKQEEVMSGDITAVDKGVYNEVFLDSLDYNGDGVSEIFTYVQAFEGASFNSYKFEDGKWIRDFEVSNYHCGY